MPRAVLPVRLRAFADLKTLHLGRRSILVTLTVELAADNIASRSAAQDLDQVACSPRSTVHVDMAFAIRFPSGSAISHSI